MAVSHKNVGIERRAFLALLSLQPIPFYSIRFDAKKYINIVSALRVDTNFIQ